ncbi:MAG: hypothetical protein WCJ30_10280 [Deltaproteobacteria bacterium]
MIGLPLGLLYANAGEWLLHKHVLHGLGKHKGSFWSFHWHEHHRAARRNGNHDESYEHTPWEWNARGKELASLAGLGLAHLPLLPVAPGFTGAVWFSLWRYYSVHKRAHLDLAWAREHLPWHMDHHLGPDQDANWCVTWPFFDMLMGTLEPYVGTAREVEDQRRAQRVNVMHTALA